MGEQNKIRDSKIKFEVFLQRFDTKYRKCKYTNMTF